MPSPSTRTSPRSPFIGVPDDEWSEAVHAVVVPAGDSAPAEDDLVVFADDRLADYETPRSVKSVDGIPKTCTGNATRWRSATAVGKTRSGMSPERHRDWATFSLDGDARIVCLDGEAELRRRRGRRVTGGRSGRRPSRRRRA